MKQILGIIILMGLLVGGCKKSSDTPQPPNVPGINGSVNAFTIYNGNLIAGGSFTKTANISANNIAQWNGSTWSALGSGLSSSVSVLTTYKGNLIAGCPNSGIFEWNGSKWSQLVSGNSNSYLFTIYNNNLVVAGQFNTIGGVKANNLAQWNDSIWSQVDTGSNSVFSSMTIYNGQLILKGSNFVVNGKAFNGDIAQWNGNSSNEIGSISAFLSTILGSTIYANNGYLYVSGDYSYSFCKDTTWAYNTMVSNTAETGVFCFGVYNGNTIAYEITTVGNAAGGPPPTSGYALYEINGSSSSLFSSAPNGVSVMIQYQNNLVIGGSFSTIGSTAVMNIAQWNGSTWSAF